MGCEAGWRMRRRGGGEEPTTEAAMEEEPGAAGELKLHWRELQKNLLVGRGVPQEEVQTGEGAGCGWRRAYSLPPSPNNHSCLNSLAGWLSGGTSGGSKGSEALAAGVS